MDKTTAQKILTMRDRTSKDRRDMADFYAVSSQWLGKDMFSWEFHDGSKLMMVYDENLAPLEILEV